MMFHKTISTGSAVASFVLILAAPQLSFSQDHDFDREGFRTVRLDPGARIQIRLNESIDVDRQDNRVYTGIVERDVRTDRDRLAIPRGTPAEMVVRVAPDNDLMLHLTAVIVDGHRYEVRTERNRVESQPNAVGAIVGAITGNEVRGRAVRVPRDSVLSFTLDRPLEITKDHRDRDRDHDRPEDR